MCWSPRWVSNQHGPHSMNPLLVRSQLAQAQPRNFRRQALHASAEQGRQLARNPRSHAAGPVPLHSLAGAHAASRAPHGSGFRNLLVIDNHGWRDAESMHGYCARHHIVSAFRQMKNADRIAVRLSSGPRHAHADERPSAPHVRDSPSQAVLGTSGTFQVLPKTCLSLSRQTGWQNPPSEPGTLGQGIGRLPSLRIRAARRGAAKHPLHDCNVMARSLGDLGCPPRWN